MNYEKFLNLVSALKRYIITNNSVMNSPKRIQSCLLGNKEYKEVQQVTNNYRMYLKGRYDLNKLVLLIIILKYGEDELFENSRQEVTRIRYMEHIHNSLSSKVEALLKFMSVY